MASGILVLIPNFGWLVQGVFPGTRCPEQFGSASRATQPNVDEIGLVVLTGVQDFVQKTGPPSAQPRLLLPSRRKGRLSVSSLRL